ncbi:MAG: DUF1573 domain-containing protein, partial [Bacteroidota bacterium]
MKHTIFLWVFLLMTVSISAGLFAQPKFVVEPATINLGIIYNGSTATTILTLKNTGTEPLRIIGIRPSCGCTAIKKPKEVLNPGESDKLEVAFNSTGFRGRSTKYVNI